VTGAAGCSSGLTPFLSPPPIWSAVRLDEYSFTNVTANKTHFRVQQVSVEEEGKVIDDFVIIK
jgi:hypothetical protein